MIRDYAASYETTDPDYAWNLRHSFDHAERSEDEGGWDSAWFWVLLCARTASVFRTHDQALYLDLEWRHLGEATRSGMVFG